MDGQRNIRSADFLGQGADVDIAADEVFIGGDEGGTSTRLIEQEVELQLRAVIERKEQAAAEGLFISGRNARRSVGIFAAQGHIHDQFYVGTLAEQPFGIHITLKGKVFGMGVVLQINPLDIEAFKPGWNIRGIGKLAD